MQLRIKDLYHKKWFWPVIVVTLFFGIYVVIGSLVYKDYGISTDEPRDLKRGQVNVDRLMGGSLADFQYKCLGLDELDRACYYPPLFSMLLYIAAPSGDTRSIYLTRHLVTFAFFAFSVFIFFLLGKKIFKDWRIGLVGSLFLIISPRIFAHSFYNPKDIPFLSAYIIAIYTLVLLIEKKNVKTLVLHGIATSIACLIRTPGLVLIPITVLFYFLDLAITKSSWRDYLKAIGYLACMTIMIAILVYAFTPVLYTHPIYNFLKSFRIMKNYPWNNYHLFMGRDITNKIPWYYSLVWFSISSPEFYLLLFLVGCTALIIKSVKTRKPEQIQDNLNLYLAATCGLLPIFIVILFKSSIYTDNRQMYFCYPPLILISIYGFKLLVDKIREKSAHWQLWAVIILALGLTYPVYFMIRYHPNQNLYFNTFAGASMSKIKQNFSFDSWGLASRQGLEYILKSDPRKTIYIKFYDTQSYNLRILTQDQRKRLKSADQKQPDYIITIYRYYPKQQLNQGQLYYSIKVGDADILSIYKIGG